MALENWIAKLEFLCIDTQGNEQKDALTLYFKLDDSAFGFATMQDRYNKIKNYISAYVGVKCANSISVPDIKTNTSLVSCIIGKTIESPGDLALNNFDAALLPAGQKANKSRRKHIMYFKGENGRRYQVSCPEPVNSIENQDEIYILSDCVFNLKISEFIGNFLLCDSRFNPLVAFKKSKFKTTK